LPYVQLLSASPSGSYTFSLFAGALPPGVQLTNVAGIYSLAGIPTTPGTCNFTIKAWNATARRDWGLELGAILIDAPPSPSLHLR
jgi:hypothetical protein